ncbi:ABC transporter permease [Kineococcus sp. SYSU DK005]|uniref:ABC transporter permease n=1 Tax=Kineococcus sp. SYSU DK005 TaxID=3383126 RepID=UPI003D7D9A1E
MALLDTSRRDVKWTRQVLTLFLVQLSNWRWSWPQMLLTGMLAPLLTVLTLGFFARTSGDAALTYALSGSIVMALLFETQSKIASNFAFMRETGALEFFASMPLRRESLMLASLAAFTLLALPSVFVTTLLGAWLLNVTLSPPWFAVVLLPLLVLPSAGIGAFIGNRSRSLEQASSTSLAVTLSLLALGPVAVPAHLLPEPLVWAGYLNPAFYAASLVRGSLLGGDLATVGRDVLALMAIALLAWALARRAMQWRT